MDVHKTHLSNADFKKMLLSELQDITDISLKTVKDRAPVELDQQATGRLSRMDAMQQQGVAASAHKHTSTTLQKVASALKRFETQEFGYCRKCEEPIGYGRLRAQPESALCLNCQSSLDN